MLISYNFLKNYLPQVPPLESICEKLTLQGLEVEKIEKYESIKGSLDGVVIGQIQKIEKHPNADRLKVCKVDVGKEVLNIVCGANNVAEGQKVAVALIGTTIYPTTDSPVTLKKSKIRGVDSEGMICAEDELGLGNDHEGILVLETSLVPGTPAAEYFKPYSDTIIHVGLTPNRSDAFSHIGVAREIASAFRIPIELPPSQSLAPFSLNELDISITVSDTTRCKRYAALSINNITITESPVWLKNQLLAIGQKPINNVVDFANYVMFELGQPLHVFDKDKLVQNQIWVQANWEEREFFALDGKNYKLLPGDLLICDGRGPVCIAGVIGGSNSSVTGITKNILIESAYFDPISIRRTSKRLGIFSESAMRFAKGADPNLVIYALERILYLLQQYCGGEVVGYKDIQVQSFSPYRVEFHLDHFWRLSGMELASEEIETILQSLEIQVLEKKGNQWILEVPTYRTDVKREQDIFEEILRIYGYNAVPIREKFFAPFQVLQGEDRIWEWQEKTADFLAAQGFYEIRTNSLMPAAAVTPQSIQVLNPLSEETAVLRTSLLPSGIEIIINNFNRQQTSFAFFELGKIYWKENEMLSEKEQLALWLAGSRYPLNPEFKPEKFQFKDLKKEIEKLLFFWGIAYTFSPLEKDSELEWGLWVEVQNQKVGKLGAAKAELCRELGIEIFFAVWEWQKITQLALAAPRIQYQEIPRFPSVRRDISLLLTSPVTYQEIEKAIRSVSPKLIYNIELFDVYQTNEGLESYAVAVTLLDRQKTLSEDEIEKIMIKILSKLENELKLTVRKG
ncbi:MAG: phenylalanine--tRNA ligase subunit beta [Bacteroidia bacterium]|nr:phenylalanine--tRNA ligase subunit beta [Bacteroidia bacterium]MDW8159123.1 phenylalanine--tRNA ligase subunit beta [Bacteroidia bacterium]